ncbi:hypothetical protein [Natrialba aegyptia]|uniref:Uncharacterized protein n=1 Tax=Natrialba aegyptia DSM 13077 TaxID=1227491 RepID=M0B4I2_9EURY|nr:hypothetical protein [Natrialba aegyptia]ELZ05735.1 hypothetical protein C480_10070 [Natrialba aegyptia DSM 13077]
MATRQTHPTHETVSSPTEIVLWTGMLTVSLLTSAILFASIAFDWGVVAVGGTTEPITVATVAVGLPVWIGVMFASEYDLLPF